MPPASRFRTNMSSPAASERRIGAQRGISLIELMIGMVVALVISLVMFNTLLFAEGQRRSTSGGGDAQQAGSMASYMTERIVRMGGAGIERVSGLFGTCKLSLKNSTGTVLLPLPGTLVAPFDGLKSVTLRAAPVLIANASVTANDTAGDTTPDALVVFGGTSPTINTWFQASSATTATTAHVIGSTGLATGDLLVAVEQDSTQANYGSANPCVIAQTTSAIDTTTTSACYRQSTDYCGRVIKIGGTLTGSEGFAPGGNAYQGTTEFADLGGAPLLQILALGPTPATATDLRSYNILDQSVLSLVDGVVNLQAVYGLRAAGNTANCTVTSWVPPTGNFSISKLLDGTNAASVARICAIRIGLITRSAIQEKNNVDAATTTGWTLFADDTALKVTGTRSGTDLKYRYRQYDVIVPVRNQILQ